MTEEMTQDNGTGALGKDKLRPEKEPGGSGGEHGKKSPQGKAGGARVHHNRASVTGVCHTGGWTGLSQRGGGTWQPDLRFRVLQASI